VLGNPAVRLRAGDVLVLPHGNAYAMSTAPGSHGGPDPEEVLTFMRQMVAGQLPFTVREGGEGPERLRLVCGFLGCDVRPFNPLLATLSRLLHLRRDSRSSGDPLEQLIDITVAESRERRPGGECVRLRLSELMFVEVVREHLAMLPAEQTGWLAGLRDPLVGRALALLHERATHPWTLARLAREVGSSRSTLADRFAQLVGRPPMRYLAHWRMQLAARLLADGTAKISAIASDVGYDSEAAFSRAFKKIVGMAPATWRQGLTRALRPAPRARVESGNGAVVAVVTGKPRAGRRSRSAASRRRSRPASRAPLARRRRRRTGNRPAAG
jgi:AraC-like DNA-binding protein